VGELEPELEPVSGEIANVKEAGGKELGSLDAEVVTAETNGNTTGDMGTVGEVPPPAVDTEPKPVDVVFEGTEPAAGDTPVQPESAEAPRDKQ
jgi:hypothetical protein